ncbi:hypothetical protein L3X38_044361 [Prunus dulcis]|uniref:Uncharacterized protein n=1 Tax=Prunus dulcis TaxID=3755 RepID=A0AAD4UYG9_PRUDU|nr:uncharacterized protein LOC117637870 [Prunus dulcis]KAI5315185.1 hypothetical protein L3X38_044361 [Prunus dulcis]
MLDSCYFFLEAGINDLIDRSLISISQDMRFKKLREASSGGRIVEMQSVEWTEMHDLVQEMGRAIARKQGSRLFNANDVYQALTNNQKDGDVQAIYLDLFEIERLHLEHVNFRPSPSLQAGPGKRQEQARVHLQRDQPSPGKLRVPRARAGPRANFDWARARVGADVVLRSS